MIRRSAVIATVAVLVSLLVHFLGLSLTSSGQAERRLRKSSEDSIALSNAFEDLAEPVSKPVEPEPAPEPEPPVETPPEPEEAEIPISEALVASVDPQRTYAPDTGAPGVVQPSSTEPVEPETSKPVDPSASDSEASDGTAAAPPIEPETVTPEGNPDASTPAVEVNTQAERSPEPEQLAALPEPATTPAAEGRPLDPDVPDPEVAPQNEEAENGTAEDQPGSADLAVTSSLRPRLPPRRPPTDQQGPFGGPKDFDDLRYPKQVVESPLSVYQRKGLDAFTRRKEGASSGGRGPGNSDVTNYAGQVLVHLNRTAAVYVPVRGFAQVFFEINPDGTLAWVDIVDSSGQPEIERAAKAQVQNAAPFPRPPGGVSRKLSFFYQNG